MSRRIYSPESIAPTEYQKFNVPDYFPKQDIAMIQQWCAHNMNLIDSGADSYDLLWPASNPREIYQGQFAISEDTTLELSGIGPCRGIILGDGIRRVLAAHIEARDESDFSELEAQKFIFFLNSLFRSKPAKIYTTSILTDLGWHQALDRAISKEWGITPEQIYMDTFNPVEISPTAQVVYTNDEFGEKQIYSLKGGT